MTGESLAFSLSKTESGEIRSDRQITDLIVTSASATGGVNFELSYKEFDDFIRAALQGSWVYYGVATPGLGQGVGTVFQGTFTSTVLTAGVAPTSTSAFT
ncbi:MAG: phage tail tube protein, partial [Acidobacteriota bacterium]